ncbi:Hypothetical_protein [Hexamita inflata]|uniref:Hypothetical_protein n=1 Tax=Hexamita inflata TaxID=28002 RepID=A0AA86QPQ9_9EUKA|nr:Hypothetical protein HINF_LOCUS49558 [Hexamita inflata]
MPENKRGISEQSQGSRCFQELQAAQPALLSVTSSRLNQSKSRFDNISQKVTSESSKSHFSTRNYSRHPQNTCRPPFSLGKFQNSEKQGQRTGQGREQRTRKANSEGISRQSELSACFRVLQAAQPALLERFVQGSSGRNPDFPCFQANILKKCILRARSSLSLPGFEVDKLETRVGLESWQEK